MQPSSLPSNQPSTYPTTTSRTLVTIYAAFTISGVSLEEFNNGAVDAFKAAIAANSFPFVRRSDITVNSVTPVVPEFRQRLDFKAAEHTGVSNDWPIVHEKGAVMHPMEIISLKVSWFVSMFLEETLYSNPDAVSDGFMKNLMDAINGGEFAATLNQWGVQAAVSDIDVTTVEKLILRTYPPTSRPSTQPSTEPSEQPSRYPSTQV